MMTAGPVGRSGAASGMLAIARLLGSSLGAASLLFGVPGTQAARPVLGVGVALALGTAAISLSRLLPAETYLK